MKRQTEAFQLSDGKDILLHKWQPEENRGVAGVIQLIHGSCEHIGRYDEFASFLADEGYVVYGWDLRGHGLSVAINEELGYFGEVNGWNLMLGDISKINSFIREKHPNEKIVLIGHSMGSFLARHYAITHGGSIDGLIAIGTAHNPRILLQLGRCLAEVDIMVRGPRNRSDLIYGLSYGSFNKGFSPPRTKQDWLTRNDKIVDSFLSDTLCGFVLTSAGFRDMFRGLLEITSYHNIVKNPKELPMLLLSGKEDPVGQGGKQVKKAYDLYKKAGIKNIQIKLYEEMRHEILNELQREVVFKDILEWLNMVKLS